MERYKIHSDAAVYYVTYSVVEWLPVFVSEGACRIVTESLNYCFKHKGLCTNAYVIMPDHVHLFVHPISVKLGKWIKGLKRALSAAIVKRNTSQSDWQPGFFDHLMRNNESYEQKWEYVRMNPVRAGLVINSEDWPYQGEIVRIERV